MSRCLLVIEHYLDFLHLLKSVVHPSATARKSKWSRSWKICFYATPMAHLDFEPTYWNSWMIRRCAYYASPRESYTTWSIITRTGYSTGLWSTLHGQAIETLCLWKQSHHFVVLSQ
jgi:hypothetical protein